MKGRRGLVLLVVLGAALLTSCVGSIPDEDFDREVQSRGGGIGNDQVEDALAALEEHLGGDLALHSVFIGPGYVTVEVRVPGTQSDLDSYYYSDHLRDPEPVTSGPTGEALQAELFRPERVAFNGLDRIVDQAIDVAGLEGGYATSAYVNRTNGRAGISVTVQNERHTATVPFTADGTLISDRVTVS